MSKINLEEYDLHPFDLEKCKAGHLTVTGDGRVFNFGVYNGWEGIKDEHRLVGWVDGSVAIYTPSGEYCYGNNIYTLHLAVSKKKKRSVIKWLLVSPYMGYTTKEAADNASKTIYFNKPRSVKVVPITFEVEE